MQIGPPQDDWPKEGCPLTWQRVGAFPVGDELVQPFDGRRLANAGLADALRSAEEFDGLPFPARHLQRALGGWPGAYDLMPYRPASGMIRDAKGIPRDAASAGISIPTFDIALAKASRGRLSAHHATPTEAAGPTVLPVPVRAIVGAGLPTPSSVRLDEARAGRDHKEQ